MNQLPLRINQTNGLLINGRYVSRRITGVERYAHEMTKRVGPHARLLAPVRPMRGLAGHMWEQLRLPGMISKGGVLWSPANTGPLGVQEQIITLHDLAVLEHPEWFAAEFAIWYQYLLPRLVRQVSLVVTSSKFSRDRILELLHLPEDKVVILRGGVDQVVFYPRSQEEQAIIRYKYKIPGKYLLFVGSIEPRKNLARLLAAWDSIRLNYPDITLVIAGGSYPSFRKPKILEISSQFHFLGYVPDEDLPAIYTGATIFIQPSYYEGFGLSVLEAMACGVPVLSSSAGALPELVGQSGLFFNPLDMRELAEKISALLDNQFLRLEQSALGSNRASEFSWDASVAEFWELLEKRLPRTEYVIH